MAAEQAWLARVGQDSPDHVIAPRREGLSVHCLQEDGS
jgi:hypothetical protein